MGVVEFRVVESRSRRRGRVVSRFLLCRRGGDGVDSFWRLSVSGLRALVDAGSDALDVFEARELARVAVTDESGEQA